jgi:hypothetical protein
VFRVILAYVLTAIMAQTVNWTLTNVYLPRVSTIQLVCSAQTCCTACQISLTMPTHLVTFASAQRDIQVLNQPKVLVKS